MASSSLSPTLPPRSRRRRVGRAFGTWVWIIGFCAGGADRDVHDVRRAAAATQDCHRQRRPERRLFPLTPSNTPRNCKKEGLSSRCARRRARWRTCACWASKARAWRSPSFRAAWPAPTRSSSCYALGSLYHEPLWVFYRGDKPARAPRSARGQAHRRRPAG